MCRHVCSHVHGNLHGHGQDVCVSMPQCAHRCCPVVDIEEYTKTLDTCVDMCTDMCTDMCLDMCMHMCMHMCVAHFLGPARSVRVTVTLRPHCLTLKTSCRADMCPDRCLNMCLDMCIGMGHGRGHTQVPSHVCGPAPVGACRGLPSFSY